MAYNLSDTKETLCGNLPNEKFFGKLKYSES